MRPQTRKGKFSKYYYDINFTEKANRSTIDKGKCFSSNRSCLNWKNDKNKNSLFLNLNYNLSIVTATSNSRNKNFNYNNNNYNYNKTQNYFRGKRNRKARNLLNKFHLVCSKWEDATKRKQDYL